jgi:hypothetical protein
MRVVLYLGPKWCFLVSHRFFWFGCNDHQARNRDYSFGFVEAGPILLDREYEATQLQSGRVRGSIKGY